MNFGNGKPLKKRTKVGIIVEGVLAFMGLVLLMEVLAFYVLSYLVSRGLIWSG